ncbi:FHA domain-containing protein [Flavobacteriaceae bacterium]|nr:FHA domain-containing protein [Flavobacteriaceae bacterium]
MQKIKIGKASSNDIVINDSSVSRKHLEVFIDDDKNVFITDLGSTNGTFVNGIKINESVKLENLDILLVGNSLVEWPRFLIDHDNPDKVYQTLKDSPSKRNKISNLKQNANNLKPIFKYFIFFIFIVFMLIIFLSTAFKYSNNNKNINVYDRVDSETSNKQINKNKQSTSVTYDFSCLSNNEDLGSGDVIYNFGELTRDVQSTFFDDIDISIENEQDAGHELLEFYKKEYRFISQGDEIKNLNSILNNLVSRLAKPRGFKYKIYLVDDPMLNALTSGGYIFLFKGMYDFCNNNSELASIISHEIAHNELGHLTLNLKKQKVASDWGILGEIFLGVENVSTQSFNQKQETEADLFGMDIIFPTRFKNCDAITLWSRMSQDEAKYDIFDNLFRSHPYSINRSICIKNHLATNYNKNCN